MWQTVILHSPTSKTALQAQVYVTEYFHEVSEHAFILTQGIFASKDLIRTTSHKPLAHRAIKSLDILSRDLLFYF